MLYVATQRLCRSENMVPGEKMDEPDDPKTTGAHPRRAGWSPTEATSAGPTGLPIWKPPYSRIIAIDMNTGEFLWEIPERRHAAAHPRASGLED